MTCTLDTAAIRKWFEQAIIGILEDGSMAALAPVTGTDSNPEA